MTVEGAPDWLAWELRHYGLVEEEEELVLKQLDKLDQEQLKMLFTLQAIAKQVKSGALVVDWDGSLARGPIYKPSREILEGRGRGAPQSVQALRPKRKQCKRCYAVYDVHQQDAACPHSPTSLLA